MRTRLIVLTFWSLGAAAVAGAQPNLPPPPGPPGHPASGEHRAQRQRGAEVTDTWERSFRIGQEGSFDLSNLFGDVEVTAIEGPEVRVRATKRVRARSTEEGRRLLEGITLKVSESRARVELHTIFPREAKHMHGAVDYAVEVPAGAAVAVRTISGDVSVAKVKGEVRLESVSGNVSALDTPRLARVKTVSGDVVLSGASAVDALTAGTVSGDLLVKGLKARVLDLATVSGDMRLLDTRCERAQVRSINGNLEFGGPLERNGRYEFISHSGDVRLRLGGQAGFELEASTFSGDIRSALQLTGTAPAARQTGPGPKHSELRGSFGDASAFLIVKTFSGSVTLAALGDPAGTRPRPKEKAPKR